MFGFLAMETETVDPRLLSWEVGMKSLMLRNADEINHLYERINVTVSKRSGGDGALQAWSDACSEFHMNYDRLAFPGGLENLDEDILSGNKIRIESALDFLDVRPYFHRSGYLYTRLIRRLKNAPLEGDQKERFDAFMVKYHEYRANRTKVE